MGVAFDITESMKLRSRLEQQNQRLGLLQSIMAKSVSRLTRGKALKTLVYEVADTFGYDFCNIFMPAADGAKLQIVASHGYTGEFVEQLNNGDLLDLNDADFIKTPVGRAFRDGIQTVMTDVAKDSPYARLKEGVKTQGFSSIVATPLGFRGERLGAMTVCTKDPHEFDREELNLLSTIAAQAAVIAGSAGIYNRLAQSEQRFRELYNSAADWMYMLDENGLIIECNDTMVQGLETSRDDVIGSHIYDWEAEGDREKAMAALAGFREKSEPGMFFASERTFVSGKGNRLVLGLHGRAMPDTKGGGLQWRMIGRDITAEHRMTTEILRRNRELAVLNAVAATASASLDLDSTLQASLISVIESMKYDVGVIFLLDPEKNELTPRVSSGAPGDMLATISHVKVGEGYAGRIAATREPYFTDDTPENPFQLPYVPKSPWFTSLGGVPVIARDKLLGVVIFATGEHHQFDEAEQALLASVGKTIGVAIENARLFDDVVRSKNEWEATFDAMTNGVSIHSQDHTIIRANRALAGLLGTTTGDLVGKKCYEVFHGINEPILICPQEKVFKDGKSHSIIAEEPYLGRVLNISSDPVFDVDGNITGIVHDVRDITEQEQLREQLAHSDKIRALGELAGGVAHDFNNFLSVILGNTQLLLSQIGNERWDGESRESLESIKRAATDAAETVRRIQEFTRVRTTRSFTAVDINRVIQHAIDVARPRWHDGAVARGVNIDIKTELGEIPLVNANESELGEVFVNLLINAADALPDGGVITLATDADAQAERVRAMVSDNGEGMEEDVRRRIFDPFYSTKGVGGSGLGLSVAYGIVNRHGGDITVESQKGAGTRFTVSLPVVTASDLAAAMEPEATLPLVRPARILVIDDAPMIRSLLGEILEQMGHSFEVAGSGAAGLELFDTAVTAGEPFDVVLTDLGMPVMSGWEVVDAVKRRSPQTPVALITGWGDQLDPEKMQQSAVDAVIPKPFKVEDIRILLAKALA